MPLNKFLILSLDLLFQEHFWVLIQLVALLTFFQHLLVNRIQSDLDQLHFNNSIALE